MENLTFLHEGKEYAATLFRSEKISPNYYWLELEHPELNRMLGDIAFIREDNHLQPVNPPMHHEYEDLFLAMKKALEKILTGAN